MSDYWTASGDPAASSGLRSDVMRQRLDTDLAAAFAKIAPYTDNAGKIVAINSGGTAQEAVTTTGTGNAVRATSPTFITPLLGTPTSGNLANCIGLPIATGVANLGTGIATFLTTPSSANLAAAVTGETGSGALVFATSPTLTTPTISGTITASGSGVLFSRTGASTGYQAFEIGNTSGYFIYGVEGDTAGQIVTGSSAYDAVLAGSNGISFSADAGTTLHARLSSSGFDVVGALTTGTPTGSASGGTGNGFTKFTGPTTSEKTFTLPNASSTIAVLNQVQAYSKAQSGTPVALTSSGGSVAVNLSLANNFTHTCTENTTLASPSNPVAGQSGVIVITQHASSPKTLSYNAFWKFAGGVVPSLTATNSAVDVLAYYVESATRATCSLMQDVK